jgi:SAM-dependent methyltransferase
MGTPPKYPRGGNMRNRGSDDRRCDRTSPVPELANPGNVVRVTVGGGHLGHPLAHENEAPFPEPLAEFFVRAYCPPGGRVLDPFCGSGTTLAVARRLGLNGVGIDIRPGQVELAERRVADPRYDPPAAAATA